MRVRGAFRIGVVFVCAGVVQTHSWLKRGVFEAIVADLRSVLRLAEGRTEEPSATILDSRTLQSSPESGHRAGYDGAKHSFPTIDSLALKFITGPSADASISGYS
jgi:hypothetical protein